LKLSNNYLMIETVTITQLETSETAH
jgi:hypothetical protein